MPVVGAVQMCSGVDVDANLESASRLIAEAAARGAELVSLPENFALLPARRGALLECAHERLDELHAFLAGEARRHGLYLIGGSIPEPADDGTRVYGCCRLFDPLGECIGSYRKIHLFDVTVADGESYRESDYTAPGSDLACVATAHGRIGLTICYDMRFPELYRALADAGAELVSVPSAFTVPTGRAHWEVLLRARAVENLCFVVAAAQAGHHANGRRTFGHSMIVDPWGEVLACLPDGEGVCIASVDTARREALMARFPVLSHRRFKQNRTDTGR